jgi:hypothetical protein
MEIGRKEDRNRKERGGKHEGIYGSAEGRGRGNKLEEQDQKKSGRGG